MLPLWQPTDGPTMGGREPVAGAVHGEVAAPVTGAGPARWHDPAESWNGAPSENEKVRVRHWVLGILKQRGPLTDQELTDLAVAARIVPSESSSPRSRRADLVREGLVRCVDKHGLTRSQKPCARWALTSPDGSAS